MAKLRRLSITLAGCILASTLAGAVSAQPRMDRGWDDGQEWRDRDRDWRDHDRGWDRGRHRGWERGRHWRERDCTYETRRFTNRFGERVIRRYRVCED